MSFHTPPHKSVEDDPRTPEHIARGMMGCVHPAYNPDYRGMPEVGDVWKPQYDPSQIIGGGQRRLRFCGCAEGGGAPPYFCAQHRAVEEIDYSKVSLPEGARLEIRTGNRPVLPTDPQERKGIPIATGVLDYFSAAIAEIAKVSKKGNDQHNPGQPLHWARGKSMDHADTLTRHLFERGTFDSDGLRHSAKMAWRALALLQQELEDAGAPMSRGSKVST